MISAIITLESNYFGFCFWNGGFLPPWAGFPARPPKLPEFTDFSKNTINTDYIPLAAGLFL